MLMHLGVSSVWASHRASLPYGHLRLRRWWTYGRGIKLLSDLQCMVRLDLFHRGRNAYKFLHVTIFSIRSVQTHGSPSALCVRFVEATTRYLDENKQLILAILDNQNLGKLNECAQFQAKLQQNLMYLAAIADSQPQSSVAHSQIPQNAAMQPGAHYVQHQQAQQQVTQSVMAARVPMQYAQQQLQQEHQHQQQLQHQQQQLHHQHQHQQSIHSQLGMGTGGNNGLQMLHNETGMGGNVPLSSRGLPDFGRGNSSNSGEGIQATRGLGADARGNKQDGVASENVHPGSGDGHVSSTGGHNADDSEPSYLKASEEEGN